MATLKPMPLRVDHTKMTRYELHKAQHGAALDRRVERLLMGSGAGISHQAGGLPTPNAAATTPRMAAPRPWAAGAQLRAAGAAGRFQTLAKRSPPPVAGMAASVGVTSGSRASSGTPQRRRPPPVAGMSAPTGGDRYRACRYRAFAASVAERRQCCAHGNRGGTGAGLSGHLADLVEYILGGLLQVGRLEAAKLSAEEPTGDDLTTSQSAAADPSLALRRLFDNFTVCSCRHEPSTNQTGMILLSSPRIMVVRVLCVRASQFQHHDRRATPRILERSSCCDGESQ